MIKRRTPNPPIHGHALQGEGHLVCRRDADGNTRWYCGCQCGAEPPFDQPFSVNAVKRWHREHKADLRGESDKSGQTS